MSCARTMPLRRTAAFASLSLIAAASAWAQPTPARRGARSMQPAPAEHFTGTVRITPVFDATSPSHVSPYLDVIISARATAAAVRVVPRDPTA